jgi:hypothetical protein
MKISRLYPIGAMLSYSVIHELGHIVAALISGFTITSISLVPSLQGSNLVLGYVQASGENGFVWSAGFLLTTSLAILMLPRNHTFALTWLALAPATSANDLFHIGGEALMRTSILMSAIVLSLWSIEHFVIK